LSLRSKYIIYLAILHLIFAGIAVVLLRQNRLWLLAIEALPRVNSDGYFADWRALVHRTDLTPKELKLLEHAARKMARAGGAR